jgi:hypothetical protein
MNPVDSYCELMTLYEIMLWQAGMQMYQHFMIEKWSKTLYWNQKIVYDTYSSCNNQLGYGEIVVS